MVYLFMVYLFMVYLSWFIYLIGTDTVYVDKLTAIQPTAIQCSIMVLIAQNFGVECKNRPERVCAKW